MNQPRSTSGFTLLELGIAVSMLGVLLVGAVSIFESTRRVHEATTTDVDLESNVQRTLERIADLLQRSRRSNVLPASPGAQAPFSASQVDFTSVTSFVGGAAVWGAAQRIEFQYSPTDPDDGLDNDGDGIIDDGAVVWTTDLGLPTQRSMILCRGVTEFANGETQDATDQNGNGLIDERGLSFDFQGSSVTVRLTVSRVLNASRQSTRSAQRMITLRNI
ncbi:MAG: type II secretion system protein J [Planctomycetota bacterium]